ncbi:toxin [Helicobacter apodemus]|uniref:Toxin n=1 Tax=Helicobacter apodemus TaxID=135569 RepID=A0A2U8FCW2_9HELI|nr:toxin [Helicobacter apodemus]
MAYINFKLCIWGRARGFAGFYRSIFYKKSFNKRFAYARYALDNRKPNWNLKQVLLDEQTRKSDPFDSFNLGASQFVNTEVSKLCLGIDESRFFALKDCEEYLKSKKFETLFTIIPITSAAVQIRSFVLDKTECIAAFFNPRLPSRIGISITPCSMDKIFSIDMSKLMLILPPLVEAKTINP